MNDNYLFNRTTKRFSDNFDEKYSKDSDTVFFSVNQNEKFEFYHDAMEDHTEKFFELVQEIANKESFYIKAISNLLRQKEYINLMYQFQTKQISSDEFAKELDENENRYLIKINQNLSIKNYKIISDIIKKIDFNFSEDDVSEVFSIRTHFIDDFLIEDKDI